MSCRNRLPLIPLSPYIQTSREYAKSLAQTTRALSEQEEQVQDTSAKASLQKRLDKEREKLDRLTKSMQSIQASCLLDFNIYDVAKEIAYINCSLFRMVTLDKTWLCNFDKQSNIVPLLDFHRYLSHSFAHQIIYGDSKKRSVAQLIHLAYTLLHVYRDFSGCTAVLTSLCMPEVRRLQSMWAPCSPKLIHAYQELATLLSPENHYEAYYHQLWLHTNRFINMTPSKSQMIAVPFMHAHLCVIQDLVQTHASVQAATDVVLSSAGQTSLTSTVHLLEFCQQFSKTDLSELDKFSCFASSTTLTTISNRRLSLQSSTNNSNDNSNKRSSWHTTKLIKIPISVCLDLELLKSDADIYHWIVSRAYLTRPQLHCESLHMEPLAEGEVEVETEEEYDMYWDFFKKDLMTKESLAASAAANTSNTTVEITASANATTIIDINTADDTTATFPLPASIHKEKKHSPAKPSRSMKTISTDKEESVQKTVDGLNVINNNKQKNQMLILVDSTAATGPEKRDTSTTDQIRQQQEADKNRAVNHKESATDDEPSTTLGQTDNSITKGSAAVITLKNEITNQDVAFEPTYDKSTAHHFKVNRHQPSQPSNKQQLHAKEEKEEMIVLISKDEAVAKIDSVQHEENNPVSSPKEDKRENEEASKTIPFQFSESSIEQNEGIIDRNEIDGNNTDIEEDAEDNIIILAEDDDEEWTGYPVDSTPSQTVADTEEDDEEWTGYPMTSQDEEEEEEEEVWKGYPIPPNEEEEEEQQHEYIQIDNNDIDDEETRKSPLEISSPSTPSEEGAELIHHHEEWKGYQKTAEEEQQQQQAEAIEQEEEDTLSSAAPTAMIENSTLTSRSNSKNHHHQLHAIGKAAARRMQYSLSNTDTNRKRLPSPFAPSSST